MNDFNPIRDLRSPEADPFNVPAGQSTQEVEDMRLRLVLTREKTENIVKIIKNKGLVFKKDVEKIQELQRRLRKTIPRIPILRGDASVEGGSEEEITRRSFGFDLDFNRRFKTKTKVPTPDKFPLFDLIFTTIVLFLTRRGGKGIKVPPFLKNLFKGKGKGADPTNIDDILKQLDKQIKELEKAKKFVPQSLRNAQKNLKLMQQNQTTAARMAAGFDKNKNKIISGKKFANKKRQQEFLKKKQQKDIDEQFAKTSEFTLDAFLKKNNLPDPFRLKREATDIFRAGETDLLIMKSRKVNPISQSSFEKAMKALQSRLDETNRQIGEYARAIQEASKSKGKVDLQKLDLFNRGKSNPIDPTVEPFEGVRKTLDEFIKSKNLRFDMEDTLYYKPKSGAFLNTKPMSNDIAMLNTDTGYRDVYVIKVDSNSIG